MDPENSPLHETPYQSPRTRSVPNAPEQSREREVSLFGAGNVLNVMATTTHYHRNGYLVCEEVTAMIMSCNRALDRWHIDGARECHINNVVTNTHDVVRSLLLNPHLRMLDFAELNNALGAMHWILDRDAPLGRPNWLCIIEGALDLVDQGERRAEQARIFIGATAQRVLNNLRLNDQQQEQEVEEGVPVQNNLDNQQQEQGAEAGAREEVEGNQTELFGETGIVPAETNCFSPIMGPSSCGTF